MCSDVYDFTKESIQKFKDAGANIGMVQVGNEITNGLLGIYSNRDKGESFNVIWGDKKKSTEVNKYLKPELKQSENIHRRLWLHYILKHQMYGNTKRS